MSVAAIIVAAGRGSRVGGAIPKQFRPLDGKSVLARTLQVFLSHGGIAQVQPVIHPEDGDLFEATRGELAETGADRLAMPVFGGATRQQSVRSGLEALAVAAPALVLI